MGLGCGVIGAAGCLESVAAGLAALPFPSVILTQVRIQGCGALSCLALGPDFRQDDGIGVAGRVGRGVRGRGERGAVPPATVVRKISVLLPHDTRGYRRWRTGVAGIAPTGRAGMRRRR